MFTSSVAARVASLALATLFALIVAPPVCAQGAEHADPPQVLILGTHHFGATADYAGRAAFDALAPDRQREIEELVALLARFRPTRIAVERKLVDDSLVNARYRAYRAGEATLRRNEDEQIGFRLAHRLGHERVYPIDHAMPQDIGRVVGWAGRNGDSAFVTYVQRFMTRIAAMHDSIARQPLVESLRRQNTPEYDALHAAYLRMALVGRDTMHVGAALVASHYERNLRIFANLARIAGPGERVLVIYGASHGKLLREFVRESGFLQLADVRDYLR